MDNRKIWTPNEVEYLDKFYKIKSVKDIARHLGYSEKQVYNKAVRMGLRKDDKNTMGDRKMSEKRRLVRQLLNMVRKAAGVPLL